MRLYESPPSGKGVNGQDTTAPVFDCSGGPCAPIPINLSVDAPTYLNSLQVNAALPLSLRGSGEHRFGVDWV